MSAKNFKGKHWSFWLVCVLGLLWNAGGSANYLVQTSMDFVNSMPTTHQAIIIGRPAWATAGFALGVFGGALGCILLMLLQRASLTVLLVSAAGIAVTMVHTMNVVMSEVEFTLGEVLVMAIAPLVVALTLLAYARFALARYGNRQE